MRSEKSSEGARERGEKGRKTDRSEGRAVAGGVRDALVFEFWESSEIHEKAQRVAGRVKVVEDLGTVLVGERGDGLDFQNDCLVADEVGDKAMTQNAVTIGERKLGLRLNRDFEELEFDLQALLINRFSEPAALRLVDGEACPHDGVALVFIKQHRGISFR